MNPATWGQYGLAGLIAMTLGTVIAYVFKLFVTSQTNALNQCRADGDRERIEKNELSKYVQDRQREVTALLADVARVMAEVQKLLQEREYDRRRDQRDRPE